MKKTSRILSALLSILLIVGCLPLSASAEEAKIPSGKCGENVTWRIQDDTLFISGTGAMYDYYLTDEDYPPYLNPAYSYKKVVIEDGVTSIGTCAFMDIYAILSGIITEDDDQAFGPRIESISLPKSVEKINNKAFFALLSLKNFEVDSENAKFTAQNGILYDKDIRTLIAYPSAKEDLFFETPESVSTIESYALFGYQNLAAITLPGVSRIKGFAISGTANVYVRNEECEFDELSAIITGKLCGRAGSTAESYAYESGITFRDIDEYPSTPTTGICGENAIFEVRDNTLFIRGTGAIDGYGDDLDWDFDTDDDGEWDFALDDDEPIFEPIDEKDDIAPYFDAELMYNHIVIEEGITSIGSSAFYNEINVGPHYEIQSISLPKSLSTLEKNALFGLNGMTKVTVKEGNTRFAVQGNGLYSKKLDNLYLLFNSSSISSFKVPATVKTIYSGAIFGNIKSVEVLSSSITVQDSGIQLTNENSKVYLPKNVMLMDMSIDCGTIYGYCGTDAQYYADENYFDFVSRGHAYKYACTSSSKATLKKDGKAYQTCTYCGKKNTGKCVTINKISKVYLSTTSYTYNGKVKTPSVTVKDSKGKTLKKNTDYTVKYPSGRKKVGKYSVKVTFKGNYSGSKTLEFTINPKGTKLKSVTPKTKSFKAKWTAQKSETSGYQIQYSTSKKFKKAKTVTVSGNKKTSKTVKKLKSTTKYYVRIRTYKTVGKTKYYSGFSGYKTVKTR